MLRCIDILLPRLAGFLPKRMQNVDDIRKLRYVNHPILSLMLDSDLSNTRPDRWHRFPVGGFQSMLNTIQLITGVSLGDCREATKRFEGAATESDVLHAKIIYLDI